VFFVFSWLIVRGEKQKGQEGQKRAKKFFFAFFALLALFVPTSDQ
jgi:hypothetical protein